MEHPQRRLRVLYVHNSADLYGASRSLVRLVGALDSRRVEAIVLLPGDGPLRERLERLGVAVRIDPRLCIIERKRLSVFKLIPFLGRIPVSAFRIARLIRQCDADVVHTNVGVIVDAALAARLAGKPHVWHIRDWYQEFGSAWWIYQKWIRLLSSRVICVSTPVADQFSTLQKVQVVHNGFDIREFELDQPVLRREFRRRYSLGDSFVIGCVGRIKFRRKGQEVLVEALKRLTPSENLKLLIVGGAHPDNASHEESLKKWVERLGLEDSVIFTGEIDDARPAYAAMDLLVLPSAQPEPFGGVVMEAMGMGLPVIATAIGGSLEQVEEGVTGFLVPPDDPDVLAERIEFLRRDTEGAARMGRQGQRRIREKFALGQMVSRVQDIYQSVTDIEGGR